MTPFRECDIDPRKVWRPEGFVLELEYKFVFFGSQKYSTEVGVAGRQEIATSQILNLKLFWYDSNSTKLYFLKYNVTCLRTYLLLYLPKIHRIFIHYVILA